jgi:hypothetical protein
MYRSMILAPVTNLPGYKAHVIEREVVLQRDTWWDMN